MGKKTRGQEAPLRSYWGVNLYFLTVGVPEAVVVIVNKLGTPLV